MSDETKVQEVESDVQAYLQAKEAVNNYVAQNDHVLGLLRELVEDMNAAAERAAKSVRAAGLSSPDFFQLSSKKVIDAKRLYEELGEDWFAAIGGQVSTEVVYTIDPATFWRHVAMRRVPQEVADLVVREETRYRMPKPVVVP